MISIVANGLVPILFKACLKLGKIIKFVYLFLLCPQKYATIACEQALCLGKKIARKGKGRGERLFRFSLSLDPRSTKGLFTGYLQRDHWSGIPSTQCKLTWPRSKIFSVLWTTVVRSEEDPGRSSMDGFFPTTPKNTETDQNGLWRHFTSLALLFLRRISTASETDETLTRLTQSTHVYMCHAISFMSYDVSDLERFPSWGVTLGISGWGCAAGSLEPLTFTRASSAEFCYPILE